jgi:hypothetical protein
MMLEVFGGAVEFGDRARDGLIRTFQAEGELQYEVGLGGVFEQPFDQGFGRIRAGERHA